MPFTISLNGLDNEMRTTQRGLLPKYYTLSKLRPLDEFDPQPSNWRDTLWNLPAENFVRDLFYHVAYRHNGAMADKDREILIFDRGVAMFEAIAVAVLATKCPPDHDLDRARRWLERILTRDRLVVPKEKLAILLLPDGNSPENSVSITMDREKEEWHSGHERHELYQRLLRSELHQQQQIGTYHSIIKVPQTHPIANIQSQIRQSIHTSTPSPLFNPTIPKPTYIYAFTGLPSSGKSTIAEAFCSHHGPNKAFRANTLYFHALTSDRLGQNIHNHPEKNQALHLYHEISRFVNSHDRLRILTLESWHQSAAVGKWLKLWLGEKLKIVHVDAVGEVRAERARIPRVGMMDKENERDRRDGVEQMRLDADLVLDNNGSSADTMSSLLQFAAMGGKHD
ncbi:MAG: hypothetical protein Q9219_006076 [cf. Caloplaca sp. 3 TL-2023]